MGPFQNNSMNSGADASLPTSLLFLDRLPVCLVIAPCRQGASTPSVRSTYFSTDPMLLFRKNRVSGHTHVFRCARPKVYDCPQAGLRLDRLRLSDQALFGALNAQSATRNLAFCLPGPVVPSANGLALTLLQRCFPCVTCWHGPPVSAHSGHATSAVSRRSLDNCLFNHTGRASCVRPSRWASGSRCPVSQVWTGRGCTCGPVRRRGVPTPPARGRN